MARKVNIWSVHFTRADEQQVRDYLVIAEVGDDQSHAVEKASEQFAADNAGFKLVQHSDVVDPVFRTNNPDPSKVFFINRVTLSNEAIF